MKHMKPRAKPKAELPELTPSLPDRDKDAYGRAIEWMRQHSPASAAQIETKLRCEGFEAAGEFAAYAAQCETLRLKPWQAPPAHVRATDPCDSPLTGVSMMAIWVTAVLHRKDPAVRERPNLEGLLRCPKSMAERVSVNSH